MVNKTLINFCMLLATLTVVQISSANPVIPIANQPQAAIQPIPPNLDAKGYILIDANSGKVLAEKNADTRMSPASLTKLMSMYVISGAIKNGTIHLEDKVHVSEKAWQTGGSRMFIKVNDEVPVKDLIQGIIVASGNDATVAMAEYLAGSEESFADMMNTTAKALGMNNSHFSDSNGLPNPNHYSTPRDLATLAQAIIRDYPEDYKLYSQKWFSYNNIRQPNRNRLLWRYQFADGLKTGHTDDAGYCLVSSAVKDGTRLIGVVMGTPSDLARTEDSVRLLSYGLHFFETHKLYNANSPVTTLRVWKGQKKEIGLGFLNDVYATFPNGQYKNVQATVELIASVKAPIVKGQRYGTLKIMTKNQLISSEPLVALEDDPKGGFFRRSLDGMSYHFHKWFSSNKTPEKVDNA